MTTMQPQPEQVTPVNKGKSTLLRALTVVAILIGTTLYAIELRDSLREGRNLAPTYVLITSPTTDLPRNTQVIVRSPWSEMELTRSQQVWQFEPGQTRAVPLLLVKATPLPQDTGAYVATGDAPPSTKGMLTNNGWTQAPISDGDEENIHTLGTEQIGQSFLLSLLGRRAINWRGDLRFAAAAAVEPFTRVFFFWLFAFFAIRTHSSPEHEPPPDKRRLNPTTPRIEGLDHLRGVAILLVFTYHCMWAIFNQSQLEWSGNFRAFDHPSRTFLALAPFTFGFGGVAIFFAISGFCIHLSHIRAIDKRWSRYFRKRFFRIYPPYFAALLFFAFCLPYSALNFEWNGLEIFYSRLFLIFNLHRDTYWGANGSFWSVAVEFQLYLLYPILYTLAKKVGWTPVLASALAIEIGIHLPSQIVEALITSDSLKFAIRMGPLGYVFSWLIGAKLADDYVAQRPLVTRKVPLTAWILLIAVTLFFKPAAMFQFTCFSLATIGLIARCADGTITPVPTPQWLNSHIARAGVISYSLYLFHQPLLNLAPISLGWINSGQFVHPAFKLLSCIAAYPIIFTLSSFTYRTLEQASIAVGNRYGQSAAHPAKEPQ